MIKRWPDYIYRVVLFISIVSNVLYFFVSRTQDKTSNSSMIVFAFELIAFIGLWIMTDVIFKHTIIRRIVLVCLILLLADNYIKGSPYRIAVLTVIYLVLTECMSIIDREAFSHRASLILLIILIAFIPISKKPIDWSWVYRTIQRIEMTAEEAVYKLSELLPIDGGPVERVGYSGMGDVAASVEESSAYQTDLYLTSSNEIGRMYLTGSSYTDWNGKNWTDRDKDITKGFLVEFLNTLYQNGYKADMVRCFSDLKTEKVEYGLIKTADIIHPAHTLRCDPITQKPALTEEGVLSSPAGEGYMCQFEYLDIDEGSPYLTNLLSGGISTGDIASYDDLSAYFDEIYGEDFSKYITRDDYENICYSIISGQMSDGTDPGKYLKVDVSEKLSNLTNDVTADCVSKYDKARAIEKYLRKYEYSFSTGTPIEDIDKVDQFLFYDQRGFCVHFASAMTVMLREAGVPARFCKGYNTVLNRRDERGKFKVSPSEAHAWCEAYIDGYGWMIFEPTPIKQNAVESSWGLLTAEDLQKAGIEPETEEETEEDEGLTPEDVAQSHIDEEKEKEKQHESNMRKLRIALIVLLGYILLMIIARWLYVVIRYFRLSYTDRAVYHINKARDRIKKVLSINEIGLPIRDVFITAKDTLPEDDESIPFDEMLFEYHQMRFGGKILGSADEVKRFSDFYSSVRKAFSRRRYR